MLLCGCMGKEVVKWNAGEMKECGQQLEVVIVLGVNPKHRFRSLEGFTKGLFFFFSSITAVALPTVALERSRP